MKEIQVEKFKYLVNEREKVVGLITISKDHYSVILKPENSLHKALKEAKKKK